MRNLVLTTVILLGSLACGACGESSTPASPSPAAGAAATVESASGAVPLGVSGVIRGLDQRAGTFSLAARARTYQVRIDSQTQVWSGGTRVRPAALNDGQAVTIRGADYGSHVLALSISINR